MVELAPSVPGDSTCHGFCNTLHTMRPAAGLIDFNHNAVQDDPIFGDFESLRHAGQETLNDRGDFPPKDTFVRAGETSIAQEGGPTGEDLFIRGLDMRMRAYDCADLAVEHSCKCDFLRSRFGVKIDKDDFGLLPEFLHFIGPNEKRILQGWLHESAAL